VEWAGSDDRPRTRLNGRKIITTKLVSKRSEVIISQMAKVPTSAY